MPRGGVGAARSDVDVEAEQNYKEVSTDFQNWKEAVDEVEKITCGLLWRRRKKISDGDVDRRCTMSM